MSLRIGNLILPSKIIQSPMAACTNFPFRLVARAKGLKFCFLEVIKAHALVQGAEEARRALASAPEEKPLGAQLIGRDPGMMADAAVILAEMGFDLIDINLGCPVNDIGSSLLNEPETVEKIFRAVRKAVDGVPITTKLRKGVQDESGEEAVELARRAEASGLAAVTVHGRTRAQRYSGRADWAAIGKIKRAVKIPVVGNGDVATPADARNLLDASGCDGIMVGRGGLGNPWIYRNLDAVMAGGDRQRYLPSIEERKTTLLRHFSLERSHYGDQQAAINIRRITTWYTHGLPENAAPRRAVRSTMDCEEIARIIAGFFDQLPADAPPPLAPATLSECLGFDADDAISFAAQRLSERRKSA